MKQPLQKNPYFWFAVGLVVVAVTIGVSVAVLRWSTGGSGGVNAGLKTYSWQVLHPDRALLQTTPPQVKIVPTEFDMYSGAPTVSGGDMAMGIFQTPEQIVQAAHRWTQYRYRTVLPAKLPSGHYDFIANLPTGAMEALQEEAKKTFGLVAERETRNMPVILLRASHTDAPGLKPGGSVRAGTPLPAGKASFRNTQMPGLASYLENVLLTPVMDDTGLSARYDFEFTNSRLVINRNRPLDALPQLRKVLQDELGLDLIQTNAPVEVLVIKPEK